MDIIIPRGSHIPFVVKKLLRFKKEYTLGKNPEKLNINIYEGNIDKV